MRSLVATLLLAGCPLRAPTPVSTEPWPPAARPDDEQRAVVERFLNAVDARDFALVYELLAAPLRQRYTVLRLASDFELEPLATERVARIRTALPVGFEISGDRATLPLAGTAALRLVREERRWRISALE